MFIQKWHYTKNILAKHASSCNMFIIGEDFVKYLGRPNEPHSPPMMFISD